MTAKQGWATHKPWWMDVLFRFSSVETVSCRRAKKVEFMVKRILQLRFPPPYFRDPSAPSANPESEGYRSSRHRWVQGCSALDEAVQRVEAETKKLQKSVQDLRPDLGGTNHDIAFLKTQVKNIRGRVEGGTTSAIVRLESQVKSIGEAIPGLRKELGKLSTKSEKDIQLLGSQLSQAKEESRQLKGIITSNALAVKEHTKEMKPLQGDVSTLKDLLNRSPAPQPRDDQRDFQTGNWISLQTILPAWATVQVRSRLFKCSLRF
ncbi:hypothetical protein VP1G_11402 [Cytospora mali]|uniref:Uncharacterized protein n=1 Tax=Cytospora mali TaxID=578113 RepID=A0A194VE93_CYTMA|nr:hypothetical protein VP1G_11402 [Valsa mali var. pyri (nom. inval.)]